MERRDVLSMIASVTGTALIGTPGLLHSSVSEHADSLAIFSNSQISLLDRVGEIIIPTTSTPGAKAAGIGSFMNTFVRDCYTDMDQAVFLDGITEIYASGFTNKKLAAQVDEVISLDEQAKVILSTRREADRVHYFTMIKQLTILGYCTSEPGTTEAFRYVSIPGRYDACVPYKKGDKAWI